MLNNKTDCLTFFHLTLELNSTRHYLGTVTHLQVTGVGERAASEYIAHCVSFRDGGSYRSLEGKVTVETEGERLFLDMGQGKTYYFRKLGT
ncbi:MAG: hypothetical protein AB2L11_11410 [Syntrophobacteraceae bacterium]